MTILRTKKLHPDAQVPTYSTAGAACFDLYAKDVKGFNKVNVPIGPGETALCGTGLAFQVPKDHVMLIFSRSGHGFNSDIRLSNCTGVIDSDYTGEVMVKLKCDATDEDAPPFVVKAGDRVAQALIVFAPQVSFFLTDTLEETERGEGGFGSTGA